MKMKILNTNTFYGANLLTASPMMSACTETEVVEYEAAPNNRIVEYKVTNAAETLYGVVDDDIETVVLYISYDQMIEIKDIVRNEDSFTVKIPESINQSIGQGISQCRLYFKTVVSNSVTSSFYRHSIYFSSPSPIEAKTAE